MNSLCTLIATWLNASLRKCVGIGTGLPEGEVESALSNPKDWIPCTMLYVIYRYIYLGFLHLLLFK